MTRKFHAARLRRLARLHGIQTSYFNVQGERVYASEDTLQSLLGALGVTVDRDISAASRSKLPSPDRPIEPVVVAWDGRLSSISIRATAGDDAIPGLHVLTEDGHTMPVEARRCTADGIADVGRSGCCTSLQITVPLNLQLPPGYHRLVCTQGGRETSSLLISAPRRCYHGEFDQKRVWGLFAPLYALRSDTDWGAGSYGELQQLAEFTSREGGHLVGTLPLLPCFYEEGNEPSPYLPVTRLLWSEFYIDVGHIPFLSDCPAALALLQDRGFLTSLESVRRSSEVAYYEVQQLKRRVLTALHAHVETTDTLKSSLRSYASSHPLLSSYASFRAAREKLGMTWQEWPDPARGGDLNEAHFEQEARSYHEFVQWLAQLQMDDCVARAAAHGVGLYLDLPVGVHPEGFDTWYSRDSFVAGVSTGAPPDSVFTNGQRWGSPPLHPEGIRESGYDYVRRYLAHHMRSSQVLRIDHVMGMHHVFCIPEGQNASAGTYLRYRPEEMYALLSLESHRHKTAIIGEDLGTVPQEVRRTMSRHGLNRMFVLYYEMDGIAGERTPSIPANCMASINTHDMPPFSSMWEGLDIRQQARVGVLPQDAVPSEQKKRRKARKALLAMLESVCPQVRTTRDAHTVLGCVLQWLGKSRARFVIVTMEDLWLETVQQNIPGVGDAYPSWRSRAAKTLERIPEDPAVREGLRMLRDAMHETARGTGGD